MAIDNTTVIPKLVAARLAEKLRRTRVYADRVDKSWQRQLEGGPGNAIQVNEINAVTVGDYTPGTAITYTGADVTAVGTIEPNKRKYWAVKIEDIDAIQSSSRLLDASVADAGVALAEQIDADVQADMIANATVGPAIAIDYNANDLDANVLKTAYINRIMNVGNMPTGGRWLIVGPFTAEVLQFTTLQNELLNAPVVSELQNGRIGSFGGLTLYVSNLAVTTAHDSGANTAQETWIYGNDSALAFVEQIRKQEMIRLQENFADAARGLYLYGSKMLHSERLWKSVVSFTNVPD